MTRKEKKREGRVQSYHLGAILYGLLGVEGAVLACDPLADHPRVLIDEHGRRRRLGGGRIISRL